MMIVIIASLVIAMLLLADFYVPIAAGEFAAGL